MEIKSRRCCVTRWGQIRNYTKYDESLRSTTGRSEMQEERNIKIKLRDIAVRM
jgi:hypothetical protein